MRSMKILEIDNQCYKIETEDFRDNNIVWHWDSTTRSVYAENTKTFRRHHLTWEEFPTFGDFINWIWKREADLSQGKMRALPGIDY